MGEPQLALQPERIETLRSRMRGKVLTAGDEGYDAARSIHNGMIDKRPDLIAQCRGAADVISAVEYARSNNLRLSIRGGGHGVPGFAVCDKGVMIDLSPMNSVRVDPVRRTARAEGGATWGDFDHESQAFGLATTGGLVRTTGIAGLTLAGGHGFLVRKFGLACDNLLSADVVTADGRFLTASETENPDLFWALRGGGGNFGVVTSFEYRLHVLGPVLGGIVLYPMNQAPALLGTYDEFLRSAPDELGALAVLGTLPDGTKAVVGLFSYCGELAAGERLLAPIRAFGPPIADQIAVMPYTALQSIVENFNPRGLRWADPAEDQKNIRWVRELADRMQPFATAGFYLNYDADATPDQVVNAFGPKKYARLAAIKAKYDPGTVFCLNQTIKPAAATA